MRLSIVIGPFWLRFHYPDTGVWHYTTRHWTHKGKNQKRTEWFQIFPTSSQRNQLPLQSPQPTTKNASSETLLK